MCTQYISIKIFLSKIFRIEHCLIAGKASKTKREDKINQTNPATMNIVIFGLNNDFHIICLS